MDNGSLRKLRLDNGFSQNELAKKLHVSPSLISKWEHGSAFPSPSMVDNIGKIYGISPQEITDILNGNRIEKVEKEIRDLEKKVSGEISDLKSSFADDMRMMGEEIKNNSANMGEDKNFINLRRATVTGLIVILTLVVFFIFLLVINLWPRKAEVEISVPIVEGTIIDEK